MATGTLTISLDAVVQNWRALDAMSQSGVQTAAVIKADGYGLGSDRVAKSLANAGAKTFFVATAQEGAKVRQALGPGLDIMVFGGHMRGDTDIINDLHLTPLLNSVEQLTRHFEALPSAPFGIQLDSGMNRLGMEPGEWAAVRDVALGQGPALVMSHLACADEPDHPMNDFQCDVFLEMTAGVQAPLSLAATGGTLLGPKFHFDMVRPGIGLYGGLPFADATPTVHLSLPIIQVRDVLEGEAVGYGNAYIAKSARRVATVSAGYADGLIRAIGNDAKVYAGDTVCPVIGRISMDLITVDITDLSGTPDALDILCSHQTVDDLADSAGTIGYEILTSLGHRYERRYA